MVGIVFQCEQNRGPRVNANGGNAKSWWAGRATRCEQDTGTDTRCVESIVCVVRAEDTPPKDKKRTKPKPLLRRLCPRALVGSYQWMYWRCWAARGWDRDRRYLGTPVAEKASKQMPIVSTPTAVLAQRGKRTDCAKSLGFVILTITCHLSLGIPTCTNVLYLGYRYCTKPYYDMSCRLARFRHSA